MASHKFEAYLHGIGSITLLVTMHTVTLQLYGTYVHSIHKLGARAKSGVWRGCTEIDHATYTLINLQHVVDGIFGRMQAASTTTVYALCKAYLCARHSIPCYSCST